MVLQIFLIVGSIALCLYGMKTLSQGILKVAGSQMRASLRRVTNHRHSNVWTGFWITAIMQSSSAMTLMAVSLVNAGLMTLGQSIAITMGANIGTTLTAWIIATFGYYINVRAFAIPIIVLALPFTYTSLVKYKPWGEILMGIALYALGFTTFVSSLPDAASLPMLSTYVSQAAGMGYVSVLLFVLIGICITVLFRSSAATILLAMGLLVGDWFEFPMAAALVIGDNVGTTLTALIASRKANISARRAAYSHLFFNLFGMIVALLLIYPVTEVLWPIITLGSGLATPAGLAYGVALYHTGFNLCTMLVLIWFIPQFKLLLARVLPISEGDEDEFHLHFIQGGILSTAELSVEEARKEAALFGIRCQKMLQLTDTFMHMAPDNTAYNHTFTRIEKYEKITDRLELEIVRYLNNIDKATLSGHMTARVRALFKMVDELESIGDVCYKLSRSIVRKNEHKIRFIPMQQQNIDRMLQYTHAAVDQMVRLLQKPELTPVDMQRAYNQEDAINSYRTLLREQNIGSVQSGYYTYQSGSIYMDVISGCEKLGDFVINVLEAHEEQSNYDPDEP